MSEEIYTGTIDTDQALELLERAVATQGEDFVYTPYPMAGCYYHPLPAQQAAGDTDPRVKTGCLIGVALRLAGVDLSGVRVSVGVAWRTPVSSSGAPEGWQSRVTEDAVNALQAAQRRQDAGGTWGEALAAARAAGYPLL